MNQPDFTNRYSTAYAHSAVRARATLLVMALVVSCVAGEALTPEQQRQHEAWMEAMRQSEQTGRARAAPGLPAAQDSGADSREAEAKRLREEQERWRAEREAREAAAAKAQRDRDAAEAAQRRESRAREEQRAQEQREYQAAEDRRREAAAAAERQRQSWRELRSTVFTVIAAIVAFGVALLPSIIAAVRRIPQRAPVGILVLLSIVSSLGIAGAPALAGAAALMWAGAWTLALWRYDHA